MLNEFEEVYFCTIVTEDYIPYALTLFESINRHYPNAKLGILICGNNSKAGYGAIEITNPAIEVLTVESLKINPLVAKIDEKYKDNLDHLRWSLKASLLLFAVKERYKKAIYFDSDIFVVGDLQFLVNSLDDHCCLITPHWRPIDPTIDALQFELCFQHGIYNAGFFGISRNGVPILEWWESVCLYNCSGSVRQGYYVDQRYLDVLPTYFDGVESVEHKGCNLAYWNLKMNTRSLEQGKLTISNEWEPIFIHFSPITIKYIVEGKDPLLAKYYNEWIKEVEDYFDSTGLTRRTAKRRTLKIYMLRVRGKMSRVSYAIGDKLGKV